MPFVSWSLSLKPRTSCQSARLPSSAPPSTATNPAPLNPAKPPRGAFSLPRKETTMTRPPDPCPACHSPTNKAYRPNLLDPGDIEPFQWCTQCAWDTDSVTAAVCPHTTTD